uniref:hypothetical protein n=1 Tax=Salmonella sp. SAL04269 TaxID=3159847 RepID=UPI00397E1687
PYSLPFLLCSPHHPYGITIRIGIFISRQEIYIITRGHSPTQLKLSGGLTSIVSMLDIKLMSKQVNVKIFLVWNKKELFLNFLSFI